MKNPNIPHGETFFRLLDLDRLDLLGETIVLLENHPLPRLRVAVTLPVDDLVILVPFFEDLFDHEYVLLPLDRTVVVARPYLPIFLEVLL